MPTSGTQRLLGLANNGPIFSAVATRRVALVGVASFVVLHETVLGRLIGRLLRTSMTPTTASNLAALSAHPTE